MRDLLTLLENLAMAEAAKKDPNAPSTLFAKQVKSIVLPNLKMTVNLRGRRLLL